MLKGINWKIFTILLVAGQLGVVAFLPLMLELIKTVASGPETVPHMPFPLIVTLALLQNGIMLAVAIIVGMILSQRIGLRMPVISAWASRTRPPDLKAIALPATQLGAAAGVVMVGVRRCVRLSVLAAGSGGSDAGTHERPFGDAGSWGNALTKHAIRAQMADVGLTPIAPPPPTRWHATDPKS